MSVSTPDAWIEAYTHVGAGNRRILERLRRVLARFREQGIECLLLKGADLLPRLYGAWGMRPMIDVDLLVREQDLPAIDRIVKDLGYRPQIDGNPVYGDPDNTFSLDLVTAIWYTDDQEGIWQRAVPRNLGNLGHLGDLPVLGMGADDLLIFLTAFSVLYRGHFSPAFPQDIALLTKKEPLNWAFILDEADRRHLKIPLFHGLSYAVGHGAAAVPPEALARLAPAGAEEKLLAFLLRRLVREQPVADLGHFLLLITRPRGKKWRWLRQAFYPSPEFLQYRYGSRGQTRPLRTRITRAFHLIAQAQNLSAKILYRVCARN
jgi:hypothetical protein